MNKQCLYYIIVRYIYNASMYICMYIKCIVKEDMYMYIYLNFDIIFILFYLSELMTSTLHSSHKTDRSLKIYEYIY